MTEITNNDLANRLDALEGLLTKHADRPPESISRMMQSFQVQLTNLDTKIDSFSERFSPIEDIFGKWTIGTEILSTVFKFITWLGGAGVAIISIWLTWKSLNR